MQQSMIFFLSFCLTFFLMASGCVQQAEEFNFKEQCVVYNNFCLNESCEGFIPSISEAIKCTGHLSEDGTLTLNIVDSETPRQADRIFTSVETGGDAMGLCFLNNSAFGEVKGMPLESLFNYCANQNFHINCKIVNPSSDRAVLQCGDKDTQQIVSRDSKGYYHIYDIPFWVGRQVDVVDTQTGEINQTANQRVQEDKSCQYIDPEFHSYVCGVPAVFIAIPQ